MMNRAFYWLVALAVIIVIAVGLVLARPSQSTVNPSAMTSDADKQAADSQSH